MKNSFFCTEKMTVGYGGKPLIKEIEIQVRKGEILTLIGPNGAGKSTILKSITRQLRLIGGLSIWTAGICRTWAIRRWRPGWRWCLRSVSGRSL